MTEQQRKAEEKKQEKARQMRYKKPIVRYLNLETIQNELWEMQSECEDVRWFVDGDEDTLINALDGDEDEAYEFRMMFADLSAECERMGYDLEEEWVPDCFDRFFVAMGAGDGYGGIFGYDAYEGDYLGLNAEWENVWAEKESKERLKRMTKDNLLDAVRQCFKVYQSYISLRYRYDCLKASIDIIREQNTGHLQMVKRIEEIYAEAEHDRFVPWSKAGKELEDLLDAMPQEAWL